MAKKTGRPSWFKVFLHQKAAIDEMPDEIVGRAFKAAMQYFETGEVPEIELVARGIFAPMRESVNEAFADFEETSEKNRRNVQKRWDKKKAPPDTNGTSGTSGTSGNELLQGDTKYTEAEADAEVFNKGYKEDKEKEGMFSRENTHAPAPSDADPPLTGAAERVYRAAMKGGMSHDEAMALIGRKKEAKDGDGA